MNPLSVPPTDQAHTWTAGLALRRWLAQPQLGAAPGWVKTGAVGRSPLRSRLAGLQLGRMLPPPECDIDALRRWHPWLTRPLADIEARLMRAAGLVLQRQICNCIHGRQRQALIDTLGPRLYEEIMQTRWQATQIEALDRLRLPVPEWRERQQVLACGLRLAHDVLLHHSPYLARRLLLLFPADISLPPVPGQAWSATATALVSTILQQEVTYDDH